MGPVRQNPIQRTVSLFICVCIARCTIVAHNIAQNRPDSFPPYPPDNHHISDDVYLREGVPEADRATAIGNMHKNLVKIANGVPEISSRTDGQTDRDTDRCTHHNTLQPGEVTMTVIMATA